MITSMLTLLHLLLFAFKLGRNITGILFREDPVPGDAQMSGLRRGLADRRSGHMVEVFVMGVTLETDGSSRA